MNPILENILKRRGVADEHITLSLSSLEKPWMLKGIREAASIVIQAIHDNRRIVIAGDYDCDGATGTSVLYRGLKGFGANDLQYIVPDRATMGYGLSIPLIDSMDRPQDVGLIITVDNGIAAFEGIKYAKSLGWDVVVTDHHLGSETVPEADAIVNPNQNGCPFPFKSTAGVGVAFYLLVAVYGILSETVPKDQLPDLRKLTDLVAIGTIADMVALESNNRIFVRYGLRRIESGEANVGIKALIDKARLNLKPGVPLTTQDIGFRVAPLINAVGRMADMTTGIRLLTTDDVEEADILADQLIVCNRERKNTERGALVEADSDILEHLDEIDPYFLSLYDPQWHEGIIGLVAGRIKEAYKKPTAVFTRNVGGYLKGSCRSVEGVHIRDMIAQVNTMHPGLIKSFGGHAMAAGLSLYKPDDLDTFNAAMRQAIRSVWNGVHVGDTPSDGQLKKSERTYGLASEIEMFPWGQGIPCPVFDGKFRVVSSKITKGNHIKFRLRDADADGTLDGVFFQRGGSSIVEPPDNGKIIHIRYQLVVNRFQAGTPSVEALIDKFSVMEQGA